MVAIVWSFCNSLFIRILLCCTIYNSIDIIWLGYETTSDCLAYASYLLALNPDKQDILYQEIEKFYHENPVSDFTLLTLLE